MVIWDYIFPLGPEISIAAFAGTVARLLDGEKRHKAKMISVVIANYLVAIYFSELIGEVTGLQSYKGMAFAIGLGGFGLVEKWFNTVLDKISENITINKKDGMDNSKKPE